MKKLIFYGIGLSLTLVACSSKTPKCSDVDVQLLVKQVSKDLYEENGFPSVQNIRSVSKDEAIKKCNCEAEIRFNNGNKYDVAYSAQYTDDEKVYVEVRSKE